MKVSELIAWLQDQDPDMLVGAISTCECCTSFEALDPDGITKAKVPVKGTYTMAPGLVFGWAPGRLFRDDQ